MSRPAPAEHDPQIAALPDVGCRRCGSTHRLLTGDGSLVCWACVMAWGAFARLVTAGPTTAEPVMVETCRAGCHPPRPSCPWCVAKRGLGVSDLGGRPKPRGSRPDGSSEGLEGR